MRKNFFSKISFTSYLLTLLLAGTFVLPLIVSAQATTPIGSNQPSDTNFQLVPCDAPPISYTTTDANGNQTSPTTNNPITGAKTTPCDFNAFITLIQRIINILLYAGIFIATLSIVYAGFLYLTAGGDTGKVKQAHEIFKVTIIGFIIAFCSWLVVYTVITAIINPNLSSISVMFLGKQ